MLLSCDRPPQRRVTVLVLILSHHEFSLSLHVSITVRCLSVTNTPVAERAGPLVSATIFHLTLTFELSHLTFYNVIHGDWAHSRD